MSEVAVPARPRRADLAKPEETVAGWWTSSVWRRRPRGPVGLPARLGRVAALEPRSSPRAPQPAIGHIAWRTYGPEDPELVAQRVDGGARDRLGRRPSVGHGRRSATTRRSAATCTRSSGTSSATRRRRRRPSPTSSTARSASPSRGAARALPRPRHGRDAEHARRHRLLQDARPAPHRRASTPSPASTSSRR